MSAQAKEYLELCIKRAEEISAKAARVRELDAKIAELEEEAGIKALKTERRQLVQIIAELAQTAVQDSRKAAQGKLFDAE